MIIIKSPQEVGAMRRAGSMVGRFFEEVREKVRPGITTYHLEEFAEEFVSRHGVRAAFKGYLGYPASLCTSVNEEVVHGIPSRSRELREGDIVSLDFGVLCDGFYGDAARTFPVGRISDSSRRLIETTERALDRAIEASERLQSRASKWGSSKMLPDRKKKPPTRAARKVRTTIRIRHPAQPSFIGLHHSTGPIFQNFGKNTG